MTVRVTTATEIGGDVKREEIVEDLKHENNCLKLVDVLDFKEVKFAEYGICVGKVWRIGNDSDDLLLEEEKFVM